MKTTLLLILVTISLSVTGQINLKFKKEASERHTFEQVYVEWVDIVATDSGWHSEQEIEEWLVHEQDTVKQIGFVYKETPTYIVLIDSYFTKQDVGSATKIPKCNIVVIKKIKIK